MESQFDLIKILEEYLDYYPTENNRQIAFSMFLNTTNSKDLYRRSNFIGHITGSAFILNKASDKILLLKHKSLGKWLQPGGHIDPTDNSILDGCIREIVEETGIKKSNLEYLNIYNENIPFDLDSHNIPANTSKNEEAHIHFDIRYCFKYLSEENIVIDKLESDGYKWINLRDLLKDPIFGKVVSKLSVF